jgi:hypothetical protein
MAIIKLHATGFEQFGGVVTQANHGEHPVAITALRSATLSNLARA